MFRGLEVFSTQHHVKLGELNWTVWTQVSNNVKYRSFADVYCTCTRAGNLGEPVLLHVRISVPCLHHSHHFLLTDLHRHGLLSALRRGHCTSCRLLPAEHNHKSAQNSSVLSDLAPPTRFFLWPSPRAGSGVERIDPLRFLAGCRKRQLNQTLSVLSLSLGFFCVCVVLLTRATFALCYLCFLSLGCSC